MTNRQLAEEQTEIIMTQLYTANLSNAENTMAQWIEENYGADFKNACLTMRNENAGSELSLDIVNSVLNARMQTVRRRSARVSRLPFNSD